MNKLSGEESFRMTLKDDYFFSLNPNYLEDAMPTAKAAHERISELIDMKRSDSIEAIQLCKIYEDVKFHYLLQFI